MNIASEEALIALLQETGDPQVADLLFKPYVVRIRNFLLSRGTYQNDIDDLVQETLLTGFLKINQFERKSTFCTWLMQIAFRKFIDSQRQSHRFKNLLERLSLARSGEVSDVAASSFERYEHLLKDLSPQQQNVFLCCDWLGYSHSEASQALLIKLGSVKTYLKQAREIISSRVEV